MVNIFPGLTSLKIIEKIPKDRQDQNIELGNFEGRIIFMSMFNDIDSTKRGKSEKCISNSEHVDNYAKRFSHGHWSFPGPGDEKKWYGTLSYTPGENGIPSPQRWWDISKKLVTQYSRASVL